MRRECRIYGWGGGGRLEYMVGGGARVKYMDRRRREGRIYGWEGGDSVEYADEEEGG